MELINQIISTVNGYVWGWPMLVLIGLTGLYLSISIRFYPITHLVLAFQQLWKGRKQQGEGEITPFNALMTSLSATIGTGNIAGVATAIFVGGPGALFWMWAIAIVGMATKYAEAVCAVNFREKDDKGHWVGGPMYYIRNGLGKNWQWLAVAFAFFGTIAGFGIGNTVQSNSVADALHATFQIPKEYTGIILAVLVGLVLLGGVKRIAAVAGKLVPIMALSYLGAGLIILLMNISALPEAFALVVKHAFTPISATGGFAGATMMLAIRYGFARGIFSNEAGLGSAPIAHAAAQTDSPVRQGTIAMLGTFIDTIIICSITGLVIIISGEWTTGVSGASLSTAAFSKALPGAGEYVVSLGLSVFAFTTILGWSVYGERCAQYLLGTKVVVPFRILWVAAIPVGTMISLDFVWLLADTLNAMMAIPNLIALLMLSPIIVKLTKEHFKE